MTPTPTVVEAARACPLLTRARALATFVGAGRPVTAKAVLRRADIPAACAATGLPRSRAGGQRRARARTAPSLDGRPGRRNPHGRAPGGTRCHDHRRRDRPVAARRGSRPACRVRRSRPPRRRDRLYRRPRRAHPQLPDCPTRTSMTPSTACWTACRCATRWPSRTRSAGACSRNPARPNCSPSAARSTPRPAPSRRWGSGHGPSSTGPPLPGSPGPTTTRSSCGSTSTGSGLRSGAACGCAPPPPSPSSTRSSRSCSSGTATTCTSSPSTACTTPIPSTSSTTAPTPTSSPWPPPYPAPAPAWPTATTSATAGTTPCFYRLHGYACAASPECAGCVCRAGVARPITSQGPTTLGTGR